MSQSEIESVLVAGRGPAACAVMRSCARLRLKAVAVHSAAEGGARHVRMADEAFALGGQTSAESYLNIDKLIAAAKESGADAVHPAPGA